MFRYYLRKARSMPPRLLAAKVRDRLRRKIAARRQKRRDLAHPTYCLRFPFPGKALHRYVEPMPAAVLLPVAGQVSAVTEHFLAHRFDLLGSGWARVKHGMSCRGLEGYRYDMGRPVAPDCQGKWLEGRINAANLKESQRLWGLIGQLPPETSNDSLQSSTTSSYQPIDWHLDFKSGYRWAEECWYQDVAFGRHPGVDVKVPWELARMQHLVQLGFAYALASRGKDDGQVAGQAHHSTNQAPNGCVTHGSGPELVTFHPPSVYAGEFRSQVLDFMATNPPRFGPNWVCAMDVGIRVANWLLAYDLLRACGTRFDEAFEEVFARSVYEHGLHIVNNLEWTPEYRGNHYLSNVVGLLHVAAYLPCSPETDGWLAFSVQELIRESDYQFLEDGANFEASTSYHRLSAELVTYGAALILGLGEEKRKALERYDHRLLRVRSGLQAAPLPLFPLPLGEAAGARGAVSGSPATGRSVTRESPLPGRFFDRLEKMAEFTLHLTKPDGRIPQIGDNDSGRLFKVQPTYSLKTVAEAVRRYANLSGYMGELPDDAWYWDEDSLDHRHLVAAVAALIPREDFLAMAGERGVERELVARLASGVQLSPRLAPGKKPAAEQVRVGVRDLCGLHERAVASLPEGRRREYRIDLPGEHGLAGLRLVAYPHFGVYMYRSERLFLSIRCGPIGRHGYGGHAHNDQLSIELQVDGKDLIVDPGAYIYTPLPERRNAYRSVQAHFAPQLLGLEPGSLDIGLFILSNGVEGRCLCFTPEFFVGEMELPGAVIGRMVKIGDEAVEIVDYLKKEDEDHKLVDLLDRAVVDHSTGYGVIVVQEEPTRHIR